ncbi:MAG TPA: hypothetical protein VNX00_14430 [Herbaspirillum sp.]|jgi:hypothetical protein|nr:hypothetical protein [Herbaspirillum sp.]
MNKLTITIASLIIFAASSAAFAQESTQVTPASAPTKKLVLPLDHGPHAQVTQWTNEQTRMRAAAADAKLAGQDKATQNAGK